MHVHGNRITIHWHTTPGSIGTRCIVSQCYADSAIPHLPTHNQTPPRLFVHFCRETFEKTNRLPLLQLTQDQYIHTAMMVNKKCLREDCENESGALRCPTCLKMGVEDSYFCSQDCFKKSWVCYTCTCISPTQCLTNMGYRRHTRLCTKHKMALSAVLIPQWPCL
jgi:hypothetical protein